MDENYIENKIFQGIDYSENKLVLREYDNCSFVDCNLSDSDLSDITFIECNFGNCNLSNCKLENTTLSDVKFANCKLLGLHFNDCNNLIISLDFKDCQLNFSSFYKLKLKAAEFKNCSLQEVDFTETDLSASIFDNCDLRRAIFENSVLDKADFLTAINFSINPETNRIYKAKFSTSGLSGLLEKYNIEIE